MNASNNRHRTRQESKRVHAAAFDNDALNQNQPQNNRYGDGTYRDPEQQRAYIPPCEPIRMTKKVVQILGNESKDSVSVEKDDEQMKVTDKTDTDSVNLRRTIYLTISSSVDFEEAGHKLMKIKLEPGQEMHLCTMLVMCCGQAKTYSSYHGLLAQRLCTISRIYRENFEACFVQQYSMVHRLETNELRNAARFFAHLLATDALPWHVMAYIRLTEEDTTSSSRIFIKILFQELSEHLGLSMLVERLSNPGMQDSFQSIFPKDNPKNTRIAINFFGCIGLNSVTENLRKYYNNNNNKRPISSGSGSGSSSSESESEFESESESSSYESSEKKNVDALPMKKRRKM